MTIRAALVPVRPTGQHTSDGHAALGRRARIALKRAMLRDVLTCLLESTLFVSVTVVTRNRALRRFCRRIGVHAVLPPPRVRGINRELTWAATRADVRQADRLLVLPGDVPGVRISELFRLVLPPLTRGIRLVPSAAGDTNALLLVPPGCVPFRFGPQSVARYRAEAERAGVSFESLPLASLSAIVDRPEDLLHGGRTAGPHTLRILARLENGCLRYERRQHHARGGHAARHQQHR